MRTLDILFVIACVFFIVIGVRRGLVGEVFRLAALIVGFFVAFLYYPDMGQMIRFNPRYLSDGLAFTIIYICAALAVIGAGWLIKKVIHLTPLGWADYLFGGAIGFAKTVLIFWVVCLSFSTFPAAQARFGVHRSVVFKAYQKLPRVIKLDGITSIRKAIKKDITGEVPRSLHNAKRHIDDLKKKVDSVKNTGGKNR